MSEVAVETPGLVTVTSCGVRRLRVVTTSEVKSFRACARAHHFGYRLRRRPVEKAATLRFGTLVHTGLEVWWKTVDLDAARAAMARPDPETRSTPDPYDLARADALLTGYHHRWKDEDLEVLGVEVPFEIPLVNPATGAASKTFRLGGKIDAIVRLADGRIAVIEHKTSAEDVGGGTVYWRRLRLDSQIANYLVGARALGFDALTCLYDVIVKPGQRPKFATPLEERKYTAPKDKACPECKKKSASPAPHTIDGVECIDGRVVTDPGGKLYANQRETDETPAEYRARILLEIGAHPEEYFVRAEAARGEAERDEAAFDLWQTVRALRDSELAERFPRNPDSCFKYGRACDYFAVCVSEASIDDPMLFRTAATSHEELAEPKEKTA